MRARDLAIGVCGAWLWLLGGCFDPTDGMAGGSGGGDADSGTGGTGGVGGDSSDNAIPGVAGDGARESGTPPCPQSDPNCTEELRAAVCEDLIECSRITGTRSLEERCRQTIDVRCVECVRALGVDDSDAGLMDDAGTAEGTSCDDAYEGSACEDACDLLDLPPSEFAGIECDAFVTTELAQDPAAAECLCNRCPKALDDCVLDDDCWLITQCSVRTGCVGMDCTAPEACQSVFDAAGALSIGPVLFETITDCVASCQTLDD